MHNRLTRFAQFCPRERKEAKEVAFTLQDTNHFFNTLIFILKFEKAFIPSSATMFALQKVFRIQGPGRFTMP